MELQVTQEKFAHALSNAGRVANSKTSLPILSNILLRTDGNKLLIAATNLEISSSNHIGAKIKKQGEIAVPARLITEFVSQLPKDVISISVSKNKLSIESGRYHSVINGVSSEEFPELPVVGETSAEVHLPLEDFKQAITQTIITASNDSTRPVLTGVYWHTHEGNLYLAATDGYRLSERLLQPDKQDIKCIIPTSSLQEVIRSIKDDDSEVSVLLNDEEVHFKLNDTIITSRLIDGSFPDYRQLIPTSSDTSAVIQKDNFTQIVKVSSLFARESGGGVTLEIDDQTSLLSIRSIASEFGENTSEAEVTDVKNNGTTTLNSRYLSDALSVTQAKTVQIRFSGKLSPVILSDTDKKTNYVHVIMPLKS